MTDFIDRIRRRDYLKLSGLAGAGALSGLAGCLGSSDATGTLATRVKDQPGDIDDFESCVVTLEGMWLKPVDSDGDEDDGGDEEAGNETDVDDSEENGSGREYYEFDEPQEADLVQLQDGTSQLVDERELEAQEYEFMQLDVAGVEGVLTDGGEATVETPGNAPLKLNQSFEIRADEQTVFVADFVPVLRGTGEYLIQPVASGTRVIYEGDDEELEDPGDAGSNDEDGADDDGDDEKAPADDVDEEGAEP